MLDLEREAKSMDRIMIVNNNMYLMILRITSLLFSMASIRVVSKLKSDVIIFKYFLLVSKIDLMYSSSMIWLSFYVMICFHDSVKTDSPLYYYLQFFYLALSEYFTSVLALTNILIEVYLSLQRIFALNKKIFIQNRHFKTVLLVIALISIIYYIPVLFVSNIQGRTHSSLKHNRSIVVFVIGKTGFGNSYAGKFTVKFLTLCRIILVTFGLCVLNTITIAKYSKYLRAKNYLLRMKSNFLKYLCIQIFLSNLNIISFIFH